MTEKIAVNEYFEWLCDKVDYKNRFKEVSFRKLLVYLYDTEFIYSIKKDANRAQDGVDLRYRFAISKTIDDYITDTILDILSGPCSMLEMMVALSIRCEETIMDDPSVGDRTGQWFWGMITNLGLGSMTDDRFDENYVEKVIDRFLNRRYEPNGKGGLFTVRHCKHDLRDIEIWTQLLWYLDTII